MHWRMLLMMRRGGSALFAVMIVVLMARGAPAQTLDAVRQEVRTAPAASSDSEKKDDDCGCDDDDNGLAGFLWDLTAGALLEGLFGGSSWEAETDACGRTRYRRWYPLPVWDTAFTPYPYFDGTPGVSAGNGWMSPGAMPLSARLAMD